ncbi:MAG: aminotransferase [Rhodobacteraceae bacterium]|nr:aminotransferase [Paracoccaceae bacterium]
MTNVTKPFLPPLDEVIPYLERIWASGVLSNNGPLHQELELALQQYLGVKHVSLFCNATIALITAQQALNIRGEVITTPYSFVATSHALTWMGNNPVFVDIDPVSLTLNPEKIERAITDRTTAIMPLHCYGNTCAVEAIQSVADEYGLKVIYDACHSFGAEDDGGSVLRHGDISVVSFHATKVFNTFEGGLLVCNDPLIKQKVDHLKNFGFVDETTVVEAGINGKMSEFNAAIGLAQLPHMPIIISKRRAIDALYRARLDGTPGVTCCTQVRQSTKNYAYFPILIGDAFPISRDEIYSKLREQNIHPRRYFYPLIPEFEMYNRLPSADISHLPVAKKISEQVLCLPIYPDLGHSEVERVCDIIQSFAI